MTGRSPSGGSGFTQGTESGYDIRPSSDLDSLTRSTYTTYGETLTPPPRSTISGTTRGIAPIGPSKSRTISRVSSGYLTAEEPPSPASSPASSSVSFEPLSTISPESKYPTVDAGSAAYKTASERPMEMDFYPASQMRSLSDHAIREEIAEEEEEPEQEVSSGIVPHTPLRYPHLLSVPVARTQVVEPSLDAIMDSLRGC